MHSRGADIKTGRVQTSQQRASGRAAQGEISGRTRDRRHRDPSACRPSKRATRAASAPLRYVSINRGPKSKTRAVEIKPRYTRGKCSR